MTKEDFYKRLGMRLQNARKRHGIRVEQVAAGINIPVSRIERIESACARITLIELVNIAAYYGCSTDDLLVDKESPYDKEPNQTAIDLQKDANYHTFLNRPPFPAPISYNKGKGESAMSEREKRNYRRELIKTFDLMKYLDQIHLSDRNRDLLLQYMNGTTAAKLSKMYQINEVRVTQILDNYIFKCSTIAGRNFLKEWRAQGR